MLKEHDRREAEAILKTFFKSALNLDSIRFELEMESELETEKESGLRDKLELLFSGKPVQYVLNEAFFYEMKLYVDEGVLIPRPETEELVDIIIKEDDDMCDKALNVIDIGTGSGCIALSIKAAQDNWKVTGIDVSLDALKVANRNANDLDIDVHFEQFDILNYYPTPRHNSFDIIVSNPPYISTEEFADMKENVLEFEPHLALFADQEDPLIFYKAIIDFGHHYLSDKGKIYVEINENYGKETLALFQKRGFDKAILRQDLSSKDRFIIAVK